MSAVSEDGHMTDLEAAKTRLQVMVGELQLRRRELWRARDAGDERAADRLRAAILLQAVEIRRVQVDCWMSGQSVYISHDRNGLPIRVTDSKEDIV